MAGHKPGTVSRESSLPARFYTDVSVREADDGFGIALDGRPVRTPARHLLMFPATTLAEAAASEWRGQGKRIDPATMPLTSLANIALDRVTAEMEAVRAEIRAYAATDLVCYRAEAPEGLVARQAALWDPVLGWAEAAFGAPFAIAGGIVHVDQPEASLDRVTEALVPHGALALAAIHVVTTLTGSALLALGLDCRAYDVETIWRAAHVDEDWQIENWGTDAEAAARRAARRREFDAAALVLMPGAVD